MIGTNQSRQAGQRYEAGPIGSQTGTVRRLFHATPGMAYQPAAWDGDDLAATLGGSDAPLLGLAGSSVADRFRSWTGRSGKRYVFSVFRLDDTARFADWLPTDGGAVVIAARRDRASTLTPLFIESTGRCPQAFARSEHIRALLSKGGCEIHVHLLASNATERQAIVADLRRSAPQAR